MLIECFVDGSSRGQGQQDIGSASCALVIYRNRKEIFRFSRCLGSKTNNEAEYEAVIHAVLVCAAQNLPTPVVYSDSAVVVNTFNDTWVPNKDYLPYYLTLKALDEEYGFKLVQVKRRWVTVADKDARHALDNLEHHLPMFPESKSKRKKRARRGESTK